MRIEVENLEKSFGTTKALNDVSFNIESSMAYGLLGRNGAGKTTAIRIILGLIDNYKGKVLVDGEDVKKKNIKFGYLPEERGLYLKHSVKEQLIYFASFYDIRRKDALKKIKYWLELFKIPEYENKKVGELSKGNKQKIQFIASVLHEPELLILDEPFSGLDPVNIEIFKDVIKTLLDGKKTIIFSSHRMDEVEEICDSVALIKKGEIVLEGNINKIKNSYNVNNLLIDGDVKDILEEMNLRYTQKENEFNIDIANKTVGFEILKNITKNNKEIDTFKFLKPSLKDIFIERLGDE